MNLFSSEEIKIKLIQKYLKNDFVRKILIMQEDAERKIHIMHSEIISNSKGYIYNKNVSKSVPMIIIH